MTHPMGAVVPNQYFAFVRKTVMVEYHTLVTYGTEEEAAAAAKEAALFGEVQARTSHEVSCEVIVRPVRQGHGVPANRDDAAYNREHRERPQWQNG